MPARPGAAPTISPTRAATRSHRVRPRLATRLRRPARRQLESAGRAGGRDQQESGDAGFRCSSSRFTLPGADSRRPAALLGRWSGRKRACCMGKLARCGSKSAGMARLGGSRASGPARPFGGRWSCVESSRTETGRNVLALSSGGSCRVAGKPLVEVSAEPWSLVERGALATVWRLSRQRGRLHRGSQRVAAAVSCRSLSRSTLSGRDSRLWNPNRPCEPIALQRSACTAHTPYSPRTRAQRDHAWTGLLHRRFRITS